MRLYPPGTRKRNRTYVARGTIDGQRYEIVTHATDKRAAEKEWREFVRTVQAERDRDRSAPVDFCAAIQRYRQAHDVGRDTDRYLRRIESSWLARRPLSDVVPADVHTLARELHPDARNETRNRQVVAPAAAVLHYCAEQTWCEYTVVRRFPEGRPVNRTPQPGALDTLIAHADTRHRRAFLVHLKHQGWRITETLDLEWDGRWSRVDLPGQRFLVYVSKARSWKVIYMAPAVVEELANLPGRRTGRVYRVGGTRQNVYRWLKPLCRELGISDFTPHQARHAFGTQMHVQGADDRDLTDLSTWVSPKSTRRYVSPPEAHLRHLLACRDAPGPADDRHDTGEEVAPTSPPHTTKRAAGTGGNSGES